MVSIHDLIAVISPDTFCHDKHRKKVKKMVKEEISKNNNNAYVDVVNKLNEEKANLQVENVNLFDYDKAKKDPFKKWGLKSPVEKHEILYDSAAEGLEPVYFWVHDFSNSIGLSLEKITDNFVSSPGSGHFSELQGKATRMQEEAMKQLGAVNQVIKSILNVVYDLRDFQLRLDFYKDVKSNDSAKRNAAIMSLKQIWLDTVDATKRGNTSIKALAQQFDYATLIDAFFAANSLADVNKLDLNERVKRIIQQRIAEFSKWIDLSEKELKKRYEIERNYLKSQYNTVKLYARWIKPYLVAAKKLEQPGYNSADLVTAFNTVILQLTVLAKSSYTPSGDVKEGLLPELFAKMEKAKKVRKYIPFFTIEFKFRSIPQKVGQHYAFGGRAEMKFTSYALNEQEMKVLKDQMEKDDVGDVMKLIEGATTDSLGQLQDDIDEFLDEKKEKKKESKLNTEDTNPFTALFSFLKGTGIKKKEDWDTSKPIKSDSDYEKIIRSQAAISAREKCFLVFDVYKKSHGMPSHKTPFEPIQA